MSQVSSIGATSPLSSRISAPVYSAERFYIPEGLKSGGASSQGDEAATEPETLEALIGKQLAETMALLQEQGPLSANDTHIALFNAIMQNRDQFPAEAFHIKTELPGGASIETEIPASNAAAASSQPPLVIPTSGLIAAALSAFEQAS
jgi:hypothetical protein